MRYKKSKCFAISWVLYNEFSVTAVLCLQLWMFSDSASLCLSSSDPSPHIGPVLDWPTSPLWNDWSAQHCSVPCFQQLCFFFCSALTLPAHANGLKLQIEKWKDVTIRHVYSRGAGDDWSTFSVKYRERRKSSVAADFLFIEVLCHAEETC